MRTYTKKTKSVSRKRSTTKSHRSNKSTSKRMRTSKTRRTNKFFGLF